MPGLTGETEGDAMKRALAALAIALAAILLTWAAVHVMISQVNPAQQAPEGHFGEPCWACHIVSAGAAIVE